MYKHLIAFEIEKSKIYRTQAILNAKKSYIFFQIFIYFSTPENRQPNLLSSK